jgi:hypothetical protein
MKLLTLKSSEKKGIVSKVAEYRHTTGDSRRYFPHDSITNTRTHGNHNQRFHGYRIGHGSYEDYRVGPDLYL